MRKVSTGEVGGRVRRPAMVAVALVLAAASGLARLLFAGVEHAGAAMPTVSIGRVLAEIEASGPRPGDVIFRRGRSILSRAVLAAEADGRFSHVGIVVLTEEGLGVVHSVPGEDGVGGGARYDPLAEFLQGDRAADAALYRLDPEDRVRAAQAADAALELSRQAVPFDGDFDLTDPQRLYCTELVWTVFQRYGTDLTDGGRDVVESPLGTRLYLLPSRLASSPRLRPIVSTTIREPSDHAH